MIGQTSERELPQGRLQRLGIKMELVQKRPTREGRQVPWAVKGYFWRSLDFPLEKDFGFTKTNRGCRVWTQGSS